MTPKVNCSNFEPNHVKPVSSIDVSKNEDGRKAFSWINTQILLKKSSQA